MTPVCNFDANIRQSLRPCIWRVHIVSGRSGFTEIWGIAIRTARNHSPARFVALLSEFRIQPLRSPAQDRAKLCSARRGKSLGWPAD